MEYNLGSNRASNFKSAERAARGRFEVTSTITPELYDTKSYYQLHVIVSITKCMKLCLRNIYCNLLLFLFNLLLISSIFVPYVAVAGKPSYIFSLVLIG